MKTNICLQLAHDSASICTHSPSTHTPSPPPRRIPLLLPTVPLPEICLRQRGFSSFYQHSRCFWPSAVESARSGAARERVLRHGPAVGGRVGGEQDVMRCGPLLLLLCVSGKLGRP